MRLVFLCAVVLVACGGKIDTGGDGGSGGVDSGGADSAKDSQAGPDVISPPAQCTPIVGNTTVASDGSCTTTAQWSCGAMQYSVQCSCPGDACSCTQQSGSSGGGKMVSKVPNMCPGCSGDVAAICGFPH